jgi:hypothetical protein
MADQPTMQQPLLDQPDQTRLTRQAWALLGQLILHEIIPTPDLDEMGETLATRAEKLHDTVMALILALEHVQ